jgi:DNA-binding XRE family transcriptional regulator
MIRRVLRSKLRIVRVELSVRAPRFLSGPFERASMSPRRRDEAQAFRTTLSRLREEVGWTQELLALKLGVSRRTVSHWESGHWLPPFKLRAHVVLALQEAPPAHVLAVADALGVSVDPRLEAVVQPLLDALDPPPAPPPQPAPRPRPAPEPLRALVDPLVREAADGMNVLASDLRSAIGRVLAAAADAGALLEDVQAAVAIGKRTKPKGS